MIKYGLKCKEKHEFEAWFPSINAYDEQKSRGLVICPFCATTQVEKAIMAPSIKKDVGTPEPQAKTSAPELAPEPLKELMKGWREHIAKNYDYVGDKFAEEAREIHEKGDKERLIYGETTPNEARELIEEGISIAPLPPMANPKNSDLN